MTPLERARVSHYAGLFALHLGLMLRAIDRSAFTEASQQHVTAAEAWRLGGE